VKFSDRIAEFKAEVTGTPEGKKKGIKLAAAAGCFLLALVVVGWRVLGTSAADGPDEPRIDTQLATQVETMVEELEQATAEETEAFEEAVRSGEVEVEPPVSIVRTHPKGAGFIPGTPSDPSHQPSEPEPEPEPDDPG